MLLFFIGCSDQKDQDDELMVDADASEIMEQVRAYEGDKAVLVNFWATWCMPCVEEFPYIMELNEKYGDDFEIIFVSVDFEEAKDEARQFLKKQNVNFTTYYKVEGDNRFIDTISENWSGALPYTMIISEDGEVSATWEGKAEYEQFEEALLTAINKG